MTAESVRYIVDDVKAAISFYTEHLGFRVEKSPAPGFAGLCNPPNYCSSHLAAFRSQTLIIKLY